VDENDLDPECLQLERIMVIKTKKKIEVDSFLLLSKLIFFFQKHKGISFI